MKKIFYFLSVLFLASSLSAQVYLDTWKVGFGLSYPRMINTTLVGSLVNAGGFGSLQYNVSEHTSLRGKLSLLYFAQEKVSRGNQIFEPSTFAATGDFDLLYDFMPCESATPYITVGVGLAFFSTDDPVDPTIEDADAAIDFKFNLGFGGKFKLDEEWELTAETGMSVLPTFRFDGDPQLNPTSTAIGGPYDSYMNFALGLLYTWSRGEESKICQLYTGITADTRVDYDKIEDIVKRYIPKEVVKEVVVEKHVQGKPAPVAGHAVNNWILVGVNFDFNSTKLTPESYPILFHALQVLLQNPDMEIEIQGHTDNIGSETYNQKVSEDRANSVKNYFVSKGVDASRLTVVGYGETMPIADNKTAAGRAINRRIEFKVK